MEPLLRRSPLEDSAGSPTGAAPRRLVGSILLVEDQPDLADYLRQLLELDEYEVAIARDGGQFQSLFARSRPDLVVLDLMLPGESGFEICGRLKAADPTVPVIILTAIDRDDARDLARRVGADAYLTKPYDYRVLRNMLEETAATVYRQTHAQTAGESRGASSGSDSSLRLKPATPAATDSDSSTAAESHSAESDAPKKAKIEFSCECGMTFRMPPRHAGRRMTCSNCTASLTVPPA